MLASQRCRYHDGRDYDCLCTKHVYFYPRSKIQDDQEGLIGTPVKDIIHCTGMLKLSKLFHLNFRGSLINVRTGNI